jgi:glycine/D-amino acid oxidase-like deaminating enzyme
MSSKVLIIGQGVAGTSLAFRCLQAGLNPTIVDLGLGRSASQVAVGLVNPISLKRITPVWKVEECFTAFYDFCTYISSLLGEDYFIRETIYKILNSQADMNAWMEKVDLPIYSDYMRNPVAIVEGTTIKGLALGPVDGGGWVRTKAFLQASRQFFNSNGHLFEGNFDKTKLDLTTSLVNYCGEQFDYVVDCSGYAFVFGEYFPGVRIVGNKGEVMTISPNEAPYRNVYSSAYFLLKSQEGDYKVGATYNRSLSDLAPSEQGKIELCEGLRKFFKADFQVLQMEAGIRPTVADRRPLIGPSSVDSRVFMLNGLGSRGYLTAPYLSELLLRSITHSDQIPSEVSCRRFLTCVSNSE